MHTGLTYGNNFTSRNARLYFYLVIQQVLTIMVFLQNINIWNNAFWIKSLVISSDWLAVVIQQKFLKIPPYIILVVWFVVQLIRSLEFLSYRGTPTLEKSVDRIFILAIHIGFGEHLKIWNEPVTGPNMFYDSVDLTGICPRFLSEELVAGEAQDFERLV